MYPLGFCRVTIYRKDFTFSRKAVMRSVAALLKPVKSPKWPPSWILPQIRNYPKIAEIEIFYAGHVE